MAEVKARTEFELDIAAMIPAPKGTVMVGGKPYEVFSILDIPSGQAMELIKVDETMPGLPLEEAVPKMRKLVQLLAPSMTDAVLDQVSTRQMIEISAAALGLADVRKETAANPLPAAASSDASTSSPAAAAPMGGA